MVKQENTLRIIMACHSCHIKSPSNQEDDCAAERDKVIDSNLCNMAMRHFKQEVGVVFQLHSECGS